MRVVEVTRQALAEQFERQEVKAEREGQTQVVVVWVCRHCAWHFVGGDGDPPPHLCPE